MGGLDLKGWEPPQKRSHGYDFGDWRRVRDAIEAAYGALGIERSDNIDRRDWDLVGLAMDYAEYASRPSCVQCKKRLRQHEIIRCLDCKMPLCETCAPLHFWPNGRPHQ